MARIRVTPEKLIDTARQYYYTSDFMSQINQSIGRAENYLYSSGLEGNVALRIEHHLGQAGQRLRKLVSETEELARQLEQAAARFETGR